MLTTDDETVYDRVLYYTQHPLRQRKDGLELGCLNQFALNYRLASSLAETVLTKFDAALREISERTKAFAKLSAKIGKANFAELTPVTVRDTVSPSWHRYSPALSGEISDDEINRIQSFLNRTSYRNGMLLSAPELAAIVHLPSDGVNSAKLRRDGNLTKPAPDFAGKGNFILGENVHRGKSITVKLSSEQFKRHIFIGGGAGGGKSTILCNLAVQTIEQGGNCCVIDTAGDLVDDVTARIPDRRIRDTIILDVSDADYPVGFNPLEAHSDTEKYLLSSDLVALFRRYSSAWGSLMEAATAHAVNAFQFNSRAGTLPDLKRFLLEKDFRAQY